MYFQRELFANLSTVPRFEISKMVRLCLIYVLSILHVAFGIYKPEHIHLSLSNSPTQMNVVWHTEQQTSDAVVEYGTRSGEYPLSIPGISSVLEYGPGYIHRATLRHLTPGSNIYFRIGNQVSLE